MPEKITIIPKYTQTVLNEKRPDLELFPMPSNRGLWKFGDLEIGSGFVASGPGTINLECVLNLLKTGISGKSAGLVLETAE